MGMLDQYVEILGSSNDSTWTTVLGSASPPSKRTLQLLQYYLTSLKFVAGRLTTVAPYWTGGGGPWKYHSFYTGVALWLSMIFNLACTQCTWLSANTPCIHLWSLLAGEAGQDQHSPSCRVLGLNNVYMHAYMHGYCCDIDHPEIQHPQ